MSPGSCGPLETAEQTNNRQEEAAEAAASGASAKSSCLARVE